MPQMEILKIHIGPGRTKKGWVGGDVSIADTIVDAIQAAKPKTHVWFAGGAAGRCIRGGIRQALDHNLIPHVDPDEITTEDNRFDTVHDRVSAVRAGFASAERRKIRFGKRPGR